MLRTYLLRPALEGPEQAKNQLLLLKNGLLLLRDLLGLVRGRGQHLALQQIDMAKTEP